MVADWLFASYLKSGRFDARDFMYIGPDSVTVATKPPASYVYTKKLSRPESYMAAMPCELPKP